MHGIMHKKFIENHKIKKEIHTYLVNLISFRYCEKVTKFEINIPLFVIVLLSNKKLFLKKKILPKINGDHNFNIRKYIVS